MALRCVLNRAKSWTVKGAMSRFVSTNVNPTFGRRYYYLPPPPPYVPKTYMYRYPNQPVSDVDVGALSSAQFAVSMYNKLEGRNIKFVRLVRGTQLNGCGTTYFLTIEGIDENGYRNVYYAQVYEQTYEFQKTLRHWELVGDMFKYPYSHDRKTTRPIEVRPAKQDRPDYFRIMSKFEEHVGRSSDDFPDAEAVQMYNIMDLGEALHYALYAVEKINKEASIGKTHEVKLNYALVKEYRNKEELIQWSGAHNLREYLVQIGQCA